MLGYGVFCSGINGGLDRRRQKQPVNLLLDFIEEANPTMHFIKPERVDIIDLFKEVYHAAGFFRQGDLVMFPRWTPPRSLSTF